MAEWATWTHAKQIERDGGPKLPVNTLARLIGEQTAPEAALSPTHARARQTATRRRLILSRLIQARGIRPLEAVLRQALAALPDPDAQRAQYARTAPQYSVGHWPTAA